MFKAYPSIVNYYQARSVQEFADIVPAGELCHFTEKVHGANLQIYINRDTLEITPARRGAMLTSGESFNGAWEMVKEQADKFKTLVRIAIASPEDHPDAVAFIVCGEICGGEYPGVKLDKPVSLVQKGVHYSPHHVFYAFDVCSQDKDGNVRFFDWTRATQMLDEAGIFRAQTLHTMTAQELVDELTQHNCIRHIPATFESTIGERLGLPRLPSNVAEGYVIKPNTTYFGGNGSRLIFKYKSDKFAEKAEAPKASKPKAFDTELEELWSIVKADFMTPDALRNRLACVTSKVPELVLTEAKHRGALLKELAMDVMKEVNSMHVGRTPATVSGVQKRVFTECGKFLQAEATRAV